MTFEEYAQKHLGNAGYSFSAIELVRMGWNARGSYGNQQGILGGSEHIPDATKMVPKGDLILAGDATDAFGMEVPKALVIQFPDEASLRAAVGSGQCQFSVFGGDV